MSTDTPRTDEARLCTICNAPVMYGERHHQCGAAVMKLERELAAAQAVIIQLRMGTCGLCNWKEREDCSGARHSMSIELAAVKAELESKNKSIDKLVTELCDRAIYLGQLKRAARHVLSDTILKDQSAEYYMRIMSIWRSWLQAAIDAAMREDKE